MIENLNLKLSGECPVTRIELFELVSSWGRKDFFTTADNISIYKSKAKECYPLENINVSEITDLSEIFCYSLYNGDLSKWNVSFCTNMYRMFRNAEFNNDSLKDWNISNVKRMNYMFSYSKFNGDISNWDVSNVESMKYMFFNSKFNNSIKNWNVSNVNNMMAMFSHGIFNGDISNWKFNENIKFDFMFHCNYEFINKYNNGKAFASIIKEDVLNWFEENKHKMISLNISNEELNDMEDYIISFENQIDKLLN